MHMEFLQLSFFHSVIVVSFLWITITLNSHDPLRGTRNRLWDPLSVDGLGIKDVFLTCA
uniref:Uncharacterized protein n=1 Tax=Rhizophora mucronata TaxID=61149 RepID=A0A2P2QP28_RHIMU